MDVVGLLYVGGLPQNYTTKRIGPVNTPTNIILKIKNVKIYYNFLWW